MDFDPFDFLSHHFEFYQRPENWLIKGCELRRSARRLYKATLPDISRYQAARNKAAKRIGAMPGAVTTIMCREPEVLPIFMLHGFALENAFKAKIVSDDPALISRTRLSQKLKDHQLNSLAKTADISLSKQEENVLDWISEVVIWKARYQTPVDVKFMASYFAVDHTITQHVRSFHRIADNVFDRVEVALRPSLPHQSRRRYSKLVNA
jgi:hypothetical protein